MTNMLINIKQLNEWLEDNPNYSEEERTLIMWAVSQFESDMIDTILNT